MRGWLLGMTVLRGMILAGLLATGYAAFSDDGVTRWLLSAEWARDPYWHPQIRWQPLQFWVTGMLQRMSGLAPAEAGLILAVATTLAWPWAFAWSLPRTMGIAARRWCLIVASTLPWGLWPGVSGLVEPWMWCLGFAALGCWRRDRPLCLSGCLILLMTCRLEAWIWAGILGAGMVWRCWRRGQHGIAAVVLASLLLWPTIWYAVLGLGDESVTMRQADAGTVYGWGGMRLLLIPAIAAITMPAWVLMAWRRRAGCLLSPPAPEAVFVGLFWLASVPVGLGTALPQRNLVFAGLLVLPWLVSRARSLALAGVVALQCWSLANPSAPLRRDLNEERSWIVSTLAEIRAEGEVLVALQSGSHAYLPRHLVIRGFPEEAIWTDHRPGRWRTNPRETWAKYMMYETGSLTDRPLVNFWRSWKPDLAFHRVESRSEVIRTLHVNNIMAVVTGSRDRWPGSFGYHLVGESRDHRIWSREFDLDKTFSYQGTLNPPLVRREALREAWRRKMPTPEALRALRELVGW